MKFMLKYDHDELLMMMRVQLVAADEMIEMERMKYEPSGWRVF